MGLLGHGPVRAWACFGHGLLWAWPAGGTACLGLLGHGPAWGMAFLVFLIGLKAFSVFASFVKVVRLLLRKKLVEKGSAL